jgi:L-lactate dehydrogenase complex protein LldG
MASTDLHERMISMFIAQVASVGGHVARVPDLAGARDYIFKLATTSNAKRIAVCARGLTDGFFHRDSPFEGLEIADRTDVPSEKFFNAVKMADIGVTLVDLAVAETGTIILATSDESERLVTALPRIHVALLPCSKLVFSLQDAELHLSKFLEEAGRGGAISLITGPSRTSDIAGRLVVGVHGPQELHVCLLNRELSGGR